MWLVYYDTIDVVVNSHYDIVNYGNILYNLNDGVFHKLDYNIYLYNEKILNSFNEPFYKNNDNTKFYFMIYSEKIYEVDLSSNTPVIKVKYDPNSYDVKFSNMNIFDDNMVYTDANSGNRFKYVTKNGSHSYLNHDIIWDELADKPYLIISKFIIDDELYIVTHTNDKHKYYNFVYDSDNDSIYLKHYKTDDVINNNTNMSYDMRYVYKYTDDENIYLFNYGEDNLVVISKNNIEHSAYKLDIVNDGYYPNNPELRTKLSKFINGFIIYTKDYIYSVNTNSKLSVNVTPIASGYKIRTMTTNNDGLVVFYGKNPSGQDVRGVINSDNTITETLVEYDSNGTLITNLD